MTGFDWFAYLAGMLFMLSAFFVHPSGSHRIACLAIAAVHFLSLSILTPYLVGAGPAFYQVFSNIDLALAVLFLIMRSSHLCAVHVAAGVMFLGWGWGYLSMLEAGSPGRYLAIEPYWFHVNGGAAYLAFHAALIIVLVLAPWLRPRPETALARLRGPALGA